MPDNLLDPFEGSCDAAKTPGEKFAKKRKIVESSLASAWFDQAGAICDARALPPHETPGYFSIADTDSIN